MPQALINARQDLVKIGFSVRHRCGQETPVQMTGTISQKRPIIMQATV